MRNLTLDSKVYCLSSESPVKSDLNNFNTLQQLFGHLKRQKKIYPKSVVGRTSSLRRPDTRSLQKPCHSEFVPLFTQAPNKLYAYLESQSAQNNSRQNSNLQFPNFGFRKRLEFLGARSMQCCERRRPPTLRHGLKSLHSKRS